MVGEFDHAICQLWQLGQFGDGGLQGDAQLQGCRAEVAGVEVPAGTECQFFADEQADAATEDGGQARLGLDDAAAATALTRWIDQFAGVSPLAVGDLFALAESDPRDQQLIASDWFGVGVGGNGTEGGQGVLQYA